MSQPQIRHNPKQKINNKKKNPPCTVQKMENKRRLLTTIFWKTWRTKWSYSLWRVRRRRTGLYHHEALQGWRMRRCGTGTCSSGRGHGRSGDEKVGKGRWRRLLLHHGFVVRWRVLKRGDTHTHTIEREVWYTHTHTMRLCA